MNLNKVIIAGRLTRDPEMRYTQTNVPVTSFTIAVSKKANGQEQTSFIDVVAWRNTAEFVDKYFKKGQAILIIGSLSTRSWKDKDGNNRKVTEIVAEEVQFAEPKRDTGVDVAQDDFIEVTSLDDLPF